MNDRAFQVLKMIFLILSIEIYLGNCKPTWSLTRKNLQPQTSAAAKEAFGTMRK